MSWRIVKESERLYGIKEDDGMTKGIIYKNDNTESWTVEMMMVSDLTYVASTFERALGYVRGVEKTVNLYAKETGRTKKRA